MHGSILNVVQKKTWQIDKPSIYFIFSLSLYSIVCKLVLIFNFEKISCLLTLSINVNNRELKYF